jgi:hypothetical protein
MLAKHALWLHENLKVEEGEEVEHVRFGVSSGTGIQMLDDTSNSVLEWVFKYLDNRRKLESEADMPVFITKGQVFIHIEKVIKYWDTFFETKPPTLREMQRVVGVIGDKDDRIFVGESGQRRRYWGVSKDILETWIRQNDLDETYLKLQLLVHSDSRKHFIMPKKLRPTEEDLAQREEARRCLEELKDLDPDEVEEELLVAQ